MNNSVENQPLKINVSLRMEVHVVDSLYPQYSIPLTKTYFHTYILNNDQILEEMYSDTTTCTNGWAVKELEYLLTEGDRIYLGATIKQPPSNNYQYDLVDYSNLIRFSDEQNTVRYIKTFTIYE